MVIDTGLKILAASALKTITLGSRFQTSNSYVKVFRSSLLLYLLIDLVHIWYGDRY